MIGVSAYSQRARFGVWDTESVVLHRWYVDAIERAGGVPVLLPPVSDGAERMVRALDGLVLSGGPDVDPRRYGESPIPETGEPASLRDEFELGLLRAALGIELPLLAVCRGMQLLNTELGGTLEQHIEGEPATVHQPNPGEFGAHEVAVREDSLLAEVLGTRARASCHHHQAIRRLGSGLRAVAHAADGTVEGVEFADRRFALAVQWHPEAQQGDDRLFEALVRECA